MELCEFIDRLIKIQLEHGPHLDVMMTNHDDLTDDEYELITCDPLVGVFEDNRFDEITSVPSHFHDELNINSVLIN